MQRQLTPRELEVMALLRQGLNYREIAERLSLTVSTIRWRLHRIFRKLLARNRVEALARTTGLPSTPPASSSLSCMGPMPERLRKVEVDILALVDVGLTNHEIANHLLLTKGTVKWHMSEILGKLQVRNRVEALQRARQLGIR